MRAMDPLQVAMTGVRMGERYLQVFCSDATLTRGLATKTGLSGIAALAAPDDAQAARARSAAGKAGALIDVKVTPPATLPWEEASFDMVVIDETGGGFSSLGRSERTASFRQRSTRSTPRRTRRDHRAAWTRPARRRAGRAGRLLRDGRRRRRAAHGRLQSGAHARRKGRVQIRRGIERMMTFTNKVAIVTGASSGIGRATALAFAGSGAHVVAVGRDASALEDVVAEAAQSGAESIAVVADLLADSAPSEIVRNTVARFGAHRRRRQRRRHHCDGYALTRPRTTCGIA